MTGWTKTRTKTRTNSSAKPRTLALAVLFAAALELAALAQAPGVDTPGPDSSQVAAPVGVPPAKLGTLSGKLGAISGRLTDLHSTPLDGATVVLRNTATGAEARTVTQKNGAYRFTGLPAGEYTIVAESRRLGQGSLEGILVSPGTEARVQTAMDFAFSAPQPADASLLAHSPAQAGPRQSVVSSLETAFLEAVLPSRALENFALPSRPFTGPVREAPSPETPAVVSVLPAEIAPSLELTARPASNPISVVSVAARAPEGLPAPNLRAVAVGPTRLHAEWALEVVRGLELSQAAAQMALAQARLRDLKASRQHADPVTPAVTTTLTAEQIQALPLAGRKWQNFVLDTPTASAQSPGAAPAAQQGNGTNATEATIDGVSTRLAFGAASGSGQSSGTGSADGSPSPGIAEPWASGHGLQVAEAAIREVQSAAGNAEAEGARAAGGQVSVTTQQGTAGFHGQAFVFDRQNTWGARNPFTEWVQETAPPTLETVPVFTAEPYTPPDHETVWGLGAGSEWKRRKLFWFAAVDRYLRNDQGLATVKHPDEFFAQPSNCDMQVLSARLGLAVPGASQGCTSALVVGLAAYSNMLEALAGLLGPAPRTASQWVGFARADWQAAERHRFTFEAAGAHWDSPGGGLTRVSEPYGSHSFGTSVASEELLMSRWEAFLTSNLMAVTQASAGRNILAIHAGTPSSFEQTLLGPSIWGQLPQMVVDSRYGFTIGNPSRFGRGSYPDEKLEDVKQSIDWVRGSLLVKAGFELAHNADATTLLRNQTGTYTYSSVLNFASDALAFQTFGVAGELNPYNQHNCDQTGKVWTDPGGNVRGLGYLPCYAYYSQMIGPGGWQMSTNDWAGFATAQWQPAKRVVVSAGMRWEREQMPPPIATVNNPELPLTERLPSPGNNWGPRVSLAIGNGESHWPVMRVGYGMYFSRTSNQVIETALTQTGSFNGDLNFFLRPTDNLNQGGAPPFPYVLAGAPGSVVKPGAVEFAPQFHNPEIHQAVAALEESLPGHIQVTASALLSLGRRLPITVDANIDPAVNPGTITYAVVDATGAGPIKTPQITVPFYASWPSSTSSTGFGGRLNPDYQQISEIMSRANSTYEAGMIKVERYGRRGLSFHAHYTYAHATDWNPNESSQIGGSSVFDPADFRQEYGTSNLDVRHSAAIMAIYTAPWKLRGAAGKLANGWMLSAIGDFRSGLPYTMRTSGSLAKEFDAATGSAIVALGPGMNGSGGDNRVYGVGRNTYRYPATWKADLRLGKSFDLGQMRRLELLAESFNLFNHQNVTELETTGYYIDSGSPAGGLPTLNFLTGLKANTTAFGQPLNINATDFYRERQIQVGMRMRF